ncbi:MAG: zinc ribbon domain-containing protein [Armatimonadota bacterium]
MLKCVKCGSLIPEKSKFCMTCGEPVTVLKEKPMIERTPIRRKYSLIAMIAALLLVLLIASLIAIKGKNDRLLSAENPNGIQSPLLKGSDVSGVPQPGILQANAPDQTGAGLLQGDTATPPPQKTGPPADVIAYLEHVKKVEQYRQTMRLDLSPAMEMLTDAYSLKTEFDDETAAQTRQSIDEGLSKYTLKWQQIVAYFNSVPAPESCRLLAGTYGDALSKYSSIMIKIQLALSKKDISSLMEMKGRAQKDVDTSLRSADAQVSSVCTAFGVAKTFSVEPDQGTDSLLSTGL